MSYSNSRHPCSQCRNFSFCVKRGYISYHFGELCLSFRLKINPPKEPTIEVDQHEKIASMSKEKPG